MATTVLSAMAKWAAELDGGALPPAVDARCRLQLLHIATQIHASPASPGLRSAGPSRGSAKLCGGGSTNAVTAATVHAARAAASDRLDYCLGGSTGVGAVSAVLALSKDKTLGDALGAIAAANETAGRIGASMALGPSHGAGNGWVHTVAAAVAAGRMVGLTERQLAHAMALALGSGGAIPRSTLASAARAPVIGMAAGRGVEAALLAAKGVQGQLDVLESPGGLLEVGCWLPLHHAFTGLGEAWLTETVAFPRWPGPAAWHAAIDCVEEILARHVKAADKRLRADQVLDITVRVPAPAVVLDRWMARHGMPEPAGLAHSVRHAIGALVANHEFSVASPVESDERIGSTAAKVRVEHDLGLTMDFIAHSLDTVLPLIGGVTEGEWRRLWGRIEGSESGWPRIGWKEMRAVAAHRPDRWLQRIKYAPRDLADGRVPQWQWRLGASVEVRTTRGGRWPMDRSIAIGGPGNPWEPLVSRVVSSFDESTDPDAGAGQALMAAGTDTDAASWMAGLLG